MDANELALHRANTKAFIDVNSVTLTLVPRVRQNTAYGTDLVNQAPRAPQVCRLIDQSGTGSPTPGEVRGADGRQRKVQYQLLMEYDATLGLYDCWTDDLGIIWEVAELFPDNGYERRGKVIRYGES